MVRRLSRYNLSMSQFSISISYPPLNSTKGSAFLSQNRQFQWTHTNNVIYPIIPASAATLLNKNNYQVFWDDAIAEKISYKQWFNRLVSRQPDLIAIETKTPVIKKHWQIIKKIKKNLPSSRIVLMGDHVTALPRESLKNSPVDYILTGGDYDFMLLSLANHISKSTKLEPGFWYRRGSVIKNSGKFALKHHALDSLPIIDRQLSQWNLYSRHNSNFKYLPGSYIMSGRDCWWGKCKFCSWTTLFPNQTFRSFSPQHQIKEIENLIKLGVREVFDDSGTLPVGDWLEKFCRLLISKKLNQKVTLGCNMRLNTLSLKQYQLLKNANFRLLLFGLESANQKTLNKINKNLEINKIKTSLDWAKQAGLSPHLTVMIGYPWETYNDAQKTLNLARQLFKLGLADSIQATILIPYPGTSLFKYCQKNKLLLTQNWNNFDMHVPIIKSPISNKLQQQLIQNLFKGVLTPRFLIKQIISIRNFDDFNHLVNYSLKFIKKLKDFS